MKADGRKWPQLQLNRAQTSTAHLFPLPGSTPRYRRSGPGGERDRHECVTDEIREAL